jgi:hypothetical protein
LGLGVVPFGYDYYPFGYDDDEDIVNCYWVRQRVHTKKGWRIRNVRACDQ